MPTMADEGAVEVMVAVLRVEAWKLGKGEAGKKAEDVRYLHSRDDLKQAVKAARSRLFQSWLQLGLDVALT